MSNLWKNQLKVSSIPTMRTTLKPIPTKPENDDCNKQLQRAAELTERMSKECEVEIKEWVKTVKATFPGNYKYKPFDEIKVNTSYDENTSKRLNISVGEAWSIEVEFR